ncbi:unnamed protein product [Brassica oleracea]
MEGLLRFLVAKVMVLALASSFVSCYDPSPLQDFCVAVDDANGGNPYLIWFLNIVLIVIYYYFFVNGKFCKDPKYVKAEDFFTSGLNIAGNTMNRVGSNVTNVNVDRIPGLNTLGVSLVRIDFAPGGQNPPHTHPRATEILVLVEGTLLVGFVTSNQDNNRLFSKVLYPGDVFVFPIGMIHFQVNVGRTNAVAFAGLGSQNPGTITIADAVFGSTPLIMPEILAKAFQLDVNVVRFLEGRFSSKYDRHY